MTFQYFFFDTYAGYFLQMFPFAAIAGVGFALWKLHRGAGKDRSLCFGLLAAYLTGLVGVTLLLQFIGDLWYFLLYRMPSGRQIVLFEWTFDFVPDFWNHFRGENLANALMFVPFGILYPLAEEHPSFRRTLTAGLVLVLVIELLQPVFGRSFDVNDVILNLAGIAASAAMLHRIHK